MLPDPERAKKLIDLTVFFALLGSGSVKAARRMLAKLTAAVIYFFFFHLIFSTLVSFTLSTSFFFSNPSDLSSCQENVSKHSILIYVNIIKCEEELFFCLGLEIRVFQSFLFCWSNSVFFAF